MTREEYTDFIDKYPELTTHGFGVDNKTYSKEKEHERLKDHFEAFQASCHMLENNFSTKPLRKHTYNSYSLKHAAEYYSENVLKNRVYVPEGALVAAVLYLGLPHQRFKRKTCILVKLQNLNRENTNNI